MKRCHCPEATRDVVVRYRERRPGERWASTACLRCAALMDSHTSPPHCRFACVAAPRSEQLFSHVWRVRDEGEADGSRRRRSDQNGHASLRGATGSVPGSGSGCGSGSGGPTFSIGVSSKTEGLPPRIVSAARIFSSAA